MLIEEVLKIFKDSLDVTTTYLRTKLEESAEIEFKKSLQTKSDTIDKQYLKTISAFANNIGGIIVFGICPDTKEVVGIKDEQDNLDNRFVSTTINLGLDGSFKYIFFTEKFLGKVVGFLSIEAAINKPVIIRTDSADQKLGEIYYRYPAQTTKILASDLRRIIDEEVANKLKNTIGNISKLVDYGNSAAILNTDSGVIDSGDSLPKFILDEKILEKLNFIKLGNFVEKDGAPAYIIKGEIEAGNVEFIEKSTPANIYERDIIKYFTARKCDSPNIVLERLLTLASPYLPIHFFIKELKLTNKEAIEYLEKVDKISIVKATSKKIIQRLTEDYDYKNQGIVMDDIKQTIIEPKISKELINEVKSIIPKAENQKIKRTLIYNTLKEKLEISDDLIKEETSLFLEAFSNIDKETLLSNQSYFLNIIDRLNDLETGVKTTCFRKTVCFVDKVYYSNNI
jgi:hypothetical protein